MDSSKDVSLDTTTDTITKEEQDTTCVKRSIDQVEADDTSNKKQKVDEETTTTTTEPELTLDEEYDDEEDNDNEDDDQDDDEEDTGGDDEATAVKSGKKENQEGTNGETKPKRPPKLNKEQLIALQNKTKITNEQSRKKKVVILLGYSGTKYKGMQKNPGLRTIEDALEKALFKAGGISPDNMYFQQKVDWVRCARTDKGVSAVRNVVSLKMEMGPPTFDEMKDALNTHLPKDIKVFAVKRVNNSFHAKNAVDARSYIYITPTSLFEPVFSEKRKQDPAAEPWKFTALTLERLNKMLSFFLGNHRYHNYTSRKDSNDVSVFRNIFSFSSSEPFVLEGVEMVALNVVGASFMLHQIRKMVGSIMSMMRKGIFEDSESDTVAYDNIKVYIEATFLHCHLNLPMAPGAGLLLDRCIFDRWEIKNSQAHGDLKFTDKFDEIEQFKNQVIFKEIASFEAQKKEFTRWVVKNLDPFPLPYETLKQLHDNPPPPPPKRQKDFNNPKNMCRKDRRDFKISQRRFNAPSTKGAQDNNNNNETTPTTTTTTTTAESTN
ncbi:hypothetical protein CYY_002923 [Polysphondylium violaceum]|uniref:Pseudouridine synthase I TruA alpha/beta domain-containing protein n=1 Tax=Polysphondylium violaceum TaxID=133409 RepID=A0A8J4PY32_9MYCE|nr:hypothetical protein CYY_002923 [Polysphondylium violaceum]